MNDQEVSKDTPPTPTATTTAPLTRDTEHTTSEVAQGVSEVKGPAATAVAPPPAALPVAAITAVCVTVLFNMPPGISALQLRRALVPLGTFAQVTEATQSGADVADPVSRTWIISWASLQEAKRMLAWNGHMLGDHRLSVLLVGTGAPIEAILQQPDLPDVAPAPTVPDPSTFTRVRLDNMFTVEQAEQQGADILADVRIECEKYGKFSREPHMSIQDTAIFLEYRDPAAAAAAAARLNGRKFDGRVVKATLS